MIKKVVIFTYRVKHLVISVTYYEAFAKHAISLFHHGLDFINLILGKKE